MSYDSVLANLESLEGTVTTETTLSLTRKSRHIIITNDDTTNDLTFKFNASETEASIKAGESVSMYARTNELIIDSTSAPYRIWIFS
jgi:cytochrome c oxidase assembly protein Cox11